MASDDTSVKNLDTEEPALRRGWTTGACATAALKSALTAYLTGEFLDPVEIRLPKGQKPSFCLNREQLSPNDFASCAIIKDAGDDPDVTHGAEIMVELRPGKTGQGLIFKAGEGVGTVTREGLPIAVGEASITPVPRQMMSDVVDELCQAHSIPNDFEVTISIPGGEALAKDTLNGRLGIVGGLSILGTTGIVIPYSCSSWIHSIHRGIDVAKAAGIKTVLASTGHMSETAVQALLNLPEQALIDMGDFAGGTLKYLRDHPVDKLVLAGGFGKFCKLAQGKMDLHSARSQVDVNWLISLVAEIDKTHAEDLSEAAPKSAAQVLAALAHHPESQVQLIERIAVLARESATRVVSSSTNVQVYLVDRQGQLLTKV